MGSAKEEKSAKDKKKWVFSKDVKDTLMQLAQEKKVEQEDQTKIDQAESALLVQTPKSFCCKWSDVYWWFWGFLLDEDTRLDRWIKGMKKKYDRREEQEASLWTKFQALKLTGTNLAPYLKQVFLESD